MSDSTPRKYDPIAVSSESTVVAEYIPEPETQTGYQSEADLERELIRLLETQAYEYLSITSETELIANLRKQLEKLNSVTFSDREWERFFTQSIAGANDGVVDKTKRIQYEHTQLLQRDDGSSKNINLIDKKNIHNNRLQVINQYAVDQGEGGSCSQQPVRRDGPRQRRADGAHRTQASWCRYP